MEPTTAYDRIFYYISKAELARQLKISSSAVSQWAGKGIPPVRAPAIEEIIDHKVTKHEMCPDFPWD